MKENFNKPKSGDKVPTIEESKTFKYSSELNIVANIDVNSYIAKRAKIEGLKHFPTVEILAVPLAHAFKKNAEKFLELTEDCDIILSEGVLQNMKLDKIALAAKQIKRIDTLKNILKQKKDNSPIATFYTEVKKTEKPNIFYEYLHQNSKQTLKYISNLFDTLYYENRFNIDKEYRELNIKGIYKKMLYKLKNFNSYHKYREWLMLNSIAPSIYEAIKKHNFINKEKVKVGMWIGALHESGVLDKMKNRGDDIDISRSMQKKKVKLLYFVKIQVANIVLEKYASEHSEDIRLDTISDYCLSELVRKNPEDIIKLVVKYKRYALDTKDFLKELQKLSELKKSKE